MKKKISAVVIAAVLVMTFFGGCSKKGLADVDIKNFNMPVEGEKPAVVTVRDYGTFKIKFFADEIPTGTENFRTLAENGYYDQLTVHRILRDGCFQGGDPKGNGQGGSSAWGGKFNDEFNEGVRCFKGAVAYANSGADSNGSQFFVVTAGPVDQAIFDQYSSAGLYFPTNVIEKYKEVGGVPQWDNNYTVFGQVFEGMDVIDKIASAEITPVNGESDGKPKQKIVFDSIKIEEYHAQ